MTDATRASGLPAMLGALAKRMRRALPTLRQAVAGTLLWAIAMMASAVLNLVLDDWASTAKIRSVVLIFAGGAALAFAPGLFAARLLSLGRGGEVAFAAGFVCLVGSTIGFTSAVFGLQYRLYYSDWHEPLTTHLGLKEFIFTVASGVYQFLVLGVRLYFPFGFAALLLACLWFARQTR